MANVMVTGVNGFVGKHLVRELVANGDTVLGVGRDHKADFSLEDFLVDYVACDLMNKAEVANLPLNKVGSVINLAGLAAVGKSFDDPELYMRVNVGVFTCLADRIKQQGLTHMRIVAVSSGSVYAPGQSLPLSEHSNVDPTSSPYAASKLAMENAVRKFRSEGYDTVIARPFNHIGPGQEEGFLLPDLFSKLATSSDEIKVGNLETRRDYTDVRDVARAYVALATAKSLDYDTYNVCSGKAVEGTEMLERLKAAMNMQEVISAVDQSQFRPSDQPILYGDNARIQNQTGWQPAIPLEQTIEDFVNSKL